MPKTLARCPNEARRVKDRVGPDHEVELAYDVPADKYFVACMTCGCEGKRCKNEDKAKDAWRQRVEMSRAGESLEGTT